MQLTFRLNRFYSITDPLNEEMRKLGYTDAGFIPPRHGFNRQLGITVFSKLLREAQRLDRIMASDTPMMVDYEKAFRWARSPKHPSCPPDWTTERSYDLVREMYNFMRLHFPHRFFTDWGRNAMWSNEVMDRLGGNLTCTCPNFNKRSDWDDDHWLAVRTQEYEENVNNWRMPVYLSLTNYVAGPNPRWLTDPEWKKTIDFTIEKEPDWICFIAGGTPDAIMDRATELRNAVVRRPEF